MCPVEPCHIKDNFPSYLYQSEKKQILRRLNENLKAQSPVEEDLLPPTEEPSCTPQEDLSVTDKRPASRGDRKKWEVEEPSVLSVAQQTLEETCVTTVCETFGEFLFNDVFLMYAEKCTCWHTCFCSGVFCGVC